MRARRLASHGVSLMMVTALAGGCGKDRGGGGGGGGGRALDGALEPIPVFAPASKTRRTTAFTSDDLEDVAKFSSYTWHFRTKASAADVEAFYLEQWPGAGRVEGSDGVYLRNPPLPPEDQPLGESVTVIVFTEPEAGRTHFAISEDVFAARRP